jgi:hypothetical protein
LALVSKSILKLFKVSKKKWGAEVDVDKAEVALCELASDLDLQDMEMQWNTSAAAGVIGVDNDNIVVNKIVKMSNEEVREFHKAIVLITKALLKARLMF